MLILITLGVVLAAPLKTPDKPVCAPEMGLYYISDTRSGTMQAKYVFCDGKVSRSLVVPARYVIGEYEREHGPLDWET